MLTAQTSLPAMSTVPASGVAVILCTQAPVHAGPRAIHTISGTAQAAITSACVAFSGTAQAAITSACVAFTAHKQQGRQLASDDQKMAQTHHRCRSDLALLLPSA